VTTSAALNATSVRVGDRSSGKTLQPSRAKGETLPLVQVLRAIAATLVLVGHTTSEIARSAVLSGAPSMSEVRLPGGFGVDLFFVISGFIMTVSSKGLFAARHSTRTFLLRRAIRLVPLYWLVTLAYALVLLVAPHGYSGSLERGIVTSLLFVPYATSGVDSSGNVYPLYSPGWTLNYEVFFYVIFGIFIALSRTRAALAVCLTLIALVLFGQALSPAPTAPRFWTEPIILEFGCGVLIGTWWLGERKALGWPLCLMAVACAASYLYIDPEALTASFRGTSTPDDFRRLLGWGIPAATLLCAVVSLEKIRRFRGRTVSWLAFLGDCSYSLYLVHPFVLLPLTKIWKVYQLGGAIGMAPLDIAVVLLSYSLAIFTHIRIEKPVTATLRRRLLAASGSVSVSQETCKQC
jgi:exopolysaccharide production protein ExoZ